MTAETAERVADTIQALGTPSRIRILSALAVGPRSVSELAAHIEMEQPAVSQQLRIPSDRALRAPPPRGAGVIAGAVTKCARNWSICPVWTYKSTNRPGLIVTGSGAGRADDGFAL